MEFIFSTEQQAKSWPEIRGSEPGVWLVHERSRKDLFIIRVRKKGGMLFESEVVTTFGGLVNSSRLSDLVFCCRLDNVFAQFLSTVDNTRYRPIDKNRDTKQEGDEFRDGFSDKWQKVSTSPGSKWADDCDYRRPIVVGDQPDSVVMDDPQQVPSLAFWEATWKAFDLLKPSMKQGAEAMKEIIFHPDSTDTERSMAINTLHSILFEQSC